MASCQFEKYKTMQSVRAMLRHCDTEKRLVTNHTNKDIDTDITHQNFQYCDGYEACCEKLDDRYEYLDSLDGQNKRKDRVVCFGVNIPAPQDLDDSLCKAWFDRVHQIITDRWGARNIIGEYVHMDEVHKYYDVDRQDFRMSRPHMHVYVVPADLETDMLCGKKFSNRANMTGLNKIIHKMSQDEFDVDFMDGSKKKNRETVETLKNKSEIEELKQKTIQDLKLQYMAQVRAVEVRLQREYAEKFEKEVDERVASILERRKQATNLSKPIMESEHAGTWEDILRRGNSQYY